MISKEIDTLLQLVNHVISQHPNLAPTIESIAAMVQGKGYTTTTTQEVDALLSRLTSPPLLAIDIGGNVGEYSAELRKRSSSLEIHTFEPSSINLRKLQERFRGDHLLNIVPFAVSDVDGVSVLFADQPGSGMGSLTKRRLDHLNLHFHAQEEVTLIRFEDYWRQCLNKRLIDVVKIDVEGHELNVLKGFGDAIARTRVIQFEFGGTNIDTRSYFRDYWYIFKEWGFQLYRIAPAGLVPITSYSESHEAFLYQNLLAVNPLLNT